MTPLDRLPEDTRARFVAMLERGALNPETAALVRDYLRRREAIAAGEQDPGPTYNPPPADVSGAIVRGGGR